MAVTDLEGLYTRVKHLMSLVNAAAPTAVVQAASNYGRGFKIPPGDAVYQVRITPATRHHRGSASYARANVLIPIHHYASSAANEETFLHETMSTVANTLLDDARWTLGWPRGRPPGDFEPGTTPKISDGTREGNVLTFEFAAPIVVGLA